MMTLSRHRRPFLGAGFEALRCTPTSPLSLPSELSG